MEYVNQLVQKCDELIAIVGGPRQTRVNEETYRNVCKLLLELKDINRKVLLQLDSSRKNVELHKAKIDTKLLLLQNLYYKKSYLSNEIKGMNYTAPFQLFLTFFYFSLSKLVVS